MGDWSHIFILVFFRLSCAFRDAANRGALQRHEASHLFGPILVNVNGLVNPLVRGRGPNN